MKIKTSLSRARNEVRYIIYGDDPGNEVACFDGLFQAALVCRYISGGAMPEKDQQIALAAIAEYDETVESGQIHLV